MTPLDMNNPSPTERAKEIARTTLEGAYDPLIACRELATFRGKLPGIDEGLMDIFVAVASEVDDLPIGPEREHWFPLVLSSKDIEAAAYRERVRSFVEESLQNLLAALG